MATHTVDLDYFLILLMNHDRLVKVLHGESRTMIIAILHLGDILADKIMREMTVITRRKGMMTPLLPTVVHVAHHMTIRTRLRII